MLSNHSEPKYLKFDFHFVIQSSFINTISSKVVGVVTDVEVVDKLAAACQYQFANQTSIGFEYKVYVLNIRYMSGMLCL